MVYPYNVLFFLLHITLLVVDFGAETFFHFLAGNILSMEGVLCLSKLSLQRSDVCLETLDNLLGMLGLTRDHSLIVTECCLQPTDPVHKDFLKLLHRII